MDGNNVAEVFRTIVFHLDDLVLGGTKLLLAEALLQAGRSSIETLGHQMVLPGVCKYRARPNLLF